MKLQPTKDIFYCKGEHHEGRFTVLEQVKSRYKFRRPKRKYNANFNYSEVYRQYGRKNKNEVLDKDAIILI